MPAVPERRPSARARPAPVKRGMGVVPVIVLGAVIVALVGGWFLLAPGGRPPAKAGFTELLAAAEAGDRTALTGLADLDLSADHLASERRDRLAKVVRPLLARSTPQEVLAPALRAAARHGCDGLALPTLELLRSWPALPDVVGGPEMPAALIARLAPGVPGRAEEADCVLAGLVQLVDGDNAGRALALLALARLEDPALGALPAMDACLASLRRALPDPAVARTLSAMAEKVFRRPDLNQGDGTVWRNRLEADLPARQRLSAIAVWIAQHGIADRIADGRAVLEEHRVFLAGAQQDLQEWLADPAWSGPLGHPRAGVEELLLRVKQAQTANRAALGGTAVGGGKR